MLISDVINVIIWEKPFACVDIKIPYLRLSQQNVYPEIHVVFFGCFDWFTEVSAETCEGITKRYNVKPRYMSLDDVPVYF